MLPTERTDVGAVHPVEIRLDRGEVEDWSRVPTRVSRQCDGGSVLRWSVADATSDEWLVEATVADVSIPDWTDRSVPRRPGKSAVVQVVPTGVGCSIGGYAADAGPATALLAACTDYLVTHPNAVNGSDFIALSDQTLYCEGSMLDAFCRERVELYPSSSNRIGLIVEQCDGSALDEVKYVTEAIRATHGVDVAEVAVTPEPIEARVQRMSSGSYSGAIERPQPLLEIAADMVDSGVTAIAIGSKLRGVENQNTLRHYSGEQPNPIGGLEASISHLVTRMFGIPSAHAPLSNERPGGASLGDIDPRAGAEVASRTGLACTLIGLSQAPQIDPDVPARTTDALNMHHVEAVVAPATSLGGVPMFEAVDRGIPLIAVEQNQTVNRATKERLGLDSVIEVDSYCEAAGVLQALREGIALDSLRRPLDPVEIRRYGEDEP